MSTKKVRYFIEWARIASNGKVTTGRSKTANFNTASIRSKRLAMQGKLVVVTCEVLHDVT